jgi:uncharacterized cupredoxin-like copper-binding protein
MRSIIGLILLLVLFAATACGGDGGANTPETQDVAVVATDIVYDTELIRVGINQPVRLTFENDGLLEHDFTVREIAVQEVHAPDENEADDHAMSEDVHDLALHVAAPGSGGQAVLEFTPTQAGEYEYYCTVSGHKEAGMVGTLIVEP